MMSDIKFSFRKNPSKSGEPQIAYITQTEFSSIVKNIDGSHDIAENLHAYSFLLNKCRQENDPLFDPWLPECFSKLQDLVVETTGRNDTDVLSVRIYLEYMKIKGWIL